MVWELVEAEALVHAEAEPPVDDGGGARGELIELGPGERRVYDLELGALDGEPAIEAFEARVESALAGAPA